MPSDRELASAYPDDSYYAYREVGDAVAPAALADQLRSTIRRFAYEGRFRARGWRTWPHQACAWLCQNRFAGFPERTKPGRLLDVGCGDGYFLQFCQRAGWHVVGIEQSLAAASRARVAGLDVRAGDFLTVPLIGQRFDVIRLWHVLEHVRDPRQALRRVRQLLSPGGELILGVPNARGFYRHLFGPRWTGWDYPRHLYHFSASGLRQLLSAEGFSVRRVRHCSVGTGLASLGPTAHRSLFLRALSVASDVILDQLHLGDGLEVHAIVGAS